MALPSPEKGSRPFKHASTQGSGLHGGQQSRPARGPRPARHIPWPEIFKHHISLVEGHLKMIDMVRKHTVPSSGNWQTIINLVERAQDMLKDAKLVSREFVPPPNQWMEVPIGSSSDSVYPGYSPAHHKYGDAAAEFGSGWANAKKRGVEFQTQPNGPQYEFGQGKGSKRRKVDEVGATTKSPAPETSDSHDANPFFVVDVEPTPVTQAMPESLPKPGIKQESSASAAQVKTSSNKDVPGEAPQVEYENIDAEVDARLKEKEAKRKSKKIAKRKRESDASAGSSTMPTAQDGEKPKKKKSKKKLDLDRAENGKAKEAPKRLSDVEMDRSNGEHNKREKKHKSKH